MRSSELALQVLVACVELLTIPPPMTGAESQNASHAGSAAVAPEQHTRALLSTLSSRYSFAYSMYLQFTRTHGRCDSLRLL